MTKSVTITLDQLKKFIDQPYHNRFVMLESAVKPLKDSLGNYVFTNHNDTKQIRDKRELAVLIARGGKSHRPARPRRAKKYNAKYLVRKIKHMGERRPHVYENYGFLHGTDVTFNGVDVTMKTRPGSKRGAFQQGQGDYLSYHETQRSVLKLAFLRAWQKIFDNMIEALAREATKP